MNTSTHAAGQLSADTMRAARRAEAEYAIHQANAAALARARRRARIDRAALAVIYTASLAAAPAVALLAMHGAPFCAFLSAVAGILAAEHIGARNGRREAIDEELTDAGLRPARE